RNSSLAMWGAAYQNERLFTSKTRAPGGIYVFEDIANVVVNDRDSVGPLDPTRILLIEGAANNLRGLFYDTVKSVLAVSELGDGTTPGTGRILIFESFSEQVEEETITPTRVITGANTGLI